MAKTPPELILELLIRKKHARSVVSSILQRAEREFEGTYLER